MNDNKASLLYTVREVAKGVTIKEEDEANVTTDLGVSLYDRFNYRDKDNKSDFNNNIDGDKDINDKNI